jgi:hypothetical protein
VVVELQLEQTADGGKGGGASWKNLSMRVDTARYPTRPPSIIYAAAGVSGLSRAAVAARTSFERAAGTTTAPLTLASLAELWNKSVAACVNAYESAAAAAPTSLAAS